MLTDQTYLTTRHMKLTSHKMRIGEKNSFEPGQGERAAR